MADRRRGLVRLCRQRPARAGADEPDHQRPRRHARGRHDHVIGENRKSRPIGGSATRPRPRRRRLCRARRRRHAAAASRPRSGAGHRALLHHQGGRQGHRPRPSMVYGFAKQSGGAMRIDSEVGEGTRVEIWLPRADEAGDTAAPAGRPPRPNGAPAAGPGCCWSTIMTKCARPPRSCSTTLATR